jgi:ATP-dependent RNA helicase HrpB
MSMLPVDAIIPHLTTALEERRNAVLQAPPGAGKTTRVPLALLNAPWLKGKRIVMLEPRRLAARAAARYLARQLGEEVGGTVGYRMRLDTKVSKRTRLEVVTEGVLTRMLQSDPSLAGVGVVIFDEIHERSVHADVGLALALQSRALFRPDLALLAMSATLQSDRIAGLLGDAPIVTSDGRVYPVQTEYLARSAEGRLEQLVTRTILRALDSAEGDVLVFLPGAAEIQRVHAHLLESHPARDTDIHQLFGNLSPAQQDLAIAPSDPGRRKVVLATAIAETSLTIEGVRVVIDSGLMRVPRFSARTGMMRLETVRVTRSSADQRRGRAGRLAPGICYRLWTEAEQATLLEHNEPEILQTDLAPLALDLAVWGVRDALELRWLDAPPAAALGQARELLRDLGALESTDMLTTHGRRMADLPLHPRLAHLVVRGNELGFTVLATELAALLGERDVLRGVSDPDLALRLHALHFAGGRGVDPGILQRVRDEALDIRRLLEHPRESRELESEPSVHGLLVAFAYPDRIAQRRAGARGRFLLRNGRGATVDQESSLAASDYIVAAQVDDRGADTRVFLGAALSEAQILTHFSSQLTTQRAVTWDRSTLSVHGNELVHLGAILLKDRPYQPEPLERVGALLEGVRADGIFVLPWERAALEFRQRLNFLHTLDSANWPDVSDTALLEHLEDWLAPALHDRREVRTLDLARALEQMLSWQQRKQLQALAPAYITVPSGSHIAIDYSEPAAPTIAVRLQELFGMMESPHVGGGRVPVVLNLLSPAQRTVQVTRDLASFWKSGYHEVKKELKGRYPKHYWPDDPFTATATRRVRPRDGDG